MFKEKSTRLVNKLNTFRGPINLKMAKKKKKKKFLTKI